MPAAYRELLGVRYPPTQSRMEDLNRGPANMWQFLDQDGSHLGRVRSRSGSMHWYAVAPAWPYVPKGSDIHLFLTPHNHREHVYHDLQTLSAEDLAPATGKALEFLRQYTREDAETLVGYNIGPDVFRPTAQSWHNLHIHFISAGKESWAEREVGSFEQLPSKLREPWAKLISRTTHAWLKNSEHPLLQQAAHPEEMRKLFGGFPTGGAIIPLGELPTAEVLAQTMVAVDASYRELHKLVFSQFVTNYEEAVTSRGETPYCLKDPAEIAASFAALPSRRKAAIGDTHEDLSRIARMLKERLEDTEDRHRNVITPPAFSVAIQQKEGRFYMVVAPALFRRGGSLESIGIQPDRQPDAHSSLDSRRHHAQQVASFLGFEQVNSNETPVKLVAQGGRRG